MYAVEIQWFKKFEQCGKDDESGDGGDLAEVGPIGNRPLL
jgi:hypothetical protein